MYFSPKKTLIISSSNMSMKLRPMVTKPSSDGTLFWPFREERAFVSTHEYGGGGGCMWPPRSYTCSFCGREFKSAQALGGHMNVHRRDRARLKQQSPSSTDQTTPPEKVLDTGSKVLVQEESRKTKREISDVDVFNNVLESSDEVKTDLSVGLVSSESSLSLKRAKKDVPKLVIGVLKMDGDKEELDLELRLGGADPPKVN